MTRDITFARARHVVAFTTLVAALATVGPVPAQAQPDQSHPNTPLVGVWNVQVTLRNCSTDAPLGPAFNSLVTFHGDGTISEAAGSVAFAPGQRTPGHGVWTRGSRRTYSQQMIALLLFSTPPNLPSTPGFDPSKPVSPGFSAGWMTVEHTVRLADKAHLSSSGTNAFYDLDGQVYRTGCSTAVGERIG